jgi:hypothetical protein
MCKGIQPCLRDWIKSNLVVPALKCRAILSDPFGIRKIPFGICRKHALFITQIPPLVMTLPASFSSLRRGGRFLDGGGGE